ncbi:RNA guanine-N7 methyltransferase activating subunit [Scleropages formosus]|uniref:RNA guanine-7 methyltransferase activating subunit n=1 Tax=Scleropages formosus TaxID=113540 RepID=A0A8C9WQG1_SCLFO|nr:RNA guanine-N7 methyltransferase activating subunit [Scleropages formosus]XP_018620630.2 RNA guanine-N7 methyltransferase activating subunit [Scleropages formosus]
MSGGVQSASACEEQFSSRLKAEHDDRKPSFPESVLNYEEQFAHRFTTADDTYQEYLKRESDPPPMVEEWRGRGAGSARGRDNRYHEYRSYRGHDRSRGWSGDQWGSRQWHDRHRAQGSGQYQSQSRYQNSYNQGHSSYSQRKPNSQY